MRALITRPEEDAAPLAQALADRQVEVAVEPLLAIRVLDDVAVDLDGVQALLFTSANGVRAFAARSARRDIGVLTVGEASAEAARAAGFAHVESAGGDVGDLVRLVKERLDPKAGALFHAAGSVVAGDLAGQLTEAGYELRRVMLYEAKPAEALSPDTLRALAAREFALVLFFSPRTAATFVELVRKTDDPRAVHGCAAATALCLSPAVAAAAEALPWRVVKSAEKPDLPAMLRLVDAAVAPAARATAASEPAPPGPVSPGPVSPESAPPESAPPGPAPSAPAPAGPASSAPAAVPATAAPRSGSGAAVAAAIVTAAIVTVAGLASEPWWRPPLAALVPALAPAAPMPAPAADPALAARVDAVVAETASLSQRLAALDGAVQQLDARDAGAGTDMADLGARLDRLAAESGTLRQDLDTVLAQPAADAPAMAPAAIPDAIAALPEEVALLRQRLDEIGASLPSGDAEAALDALRREVGALETASRGVESWIDAIDSRLAAAEALEPRIAALEQATSSAETRATENAALALALNQLQAALAGQRPFAVELAALGDLAASDPEVAAQIGAATDRLAERAATGVPTLVELRAVFPEVARAVVAAARAESAARAVAEAAPGGEAAADEGGPEWLDAAMEKLSELVSVRPVGEDVEGDDAAARTARAEARLGKGDLAGAVAELDGLSGKAVEAAAGWLADARARLAAEDAIAALQSLAVARLAPAGSGG